MSTAFTKGDIAAATNIIDIHIMKAKVGTSDEDWGTCARSLRLLARQAEDAALMAEALNRAKFAGGKQ